MRRTLHAALGLAVLLVAGLGTATTSLAQRSESKPSEKSGKASSVSNAIRAINERFDQQHQDVERHRLEALSELAREQSAEDAETTYRHLFSRAIVDGRVEGAERAATDYLHKQGAKSDPQTRAMAAFIATFAAASHDRYDQAVQILDGFLKKSDTERMDSSLLYGLGVSFLQRLILDGEFDAARETCRLFADGPFDQDVKAHFESTLNRLEMLGKTAPAIQGLDIDGEAVSLADLKGRVVLVEFWATWCPPCLAAIPRLNALHDRYQDKGLTILGVNVDAKRPGSTPEEVRSQARSLLVEFLVPWRVILNGEGERDLTVSYGVTEIPASFLVDQEGRMARVDLTGVAVDQAVAELLGVEAEESPLLSRPETGSPTSGEATEPLPDSGTSPRSPRD